MRGAARITLEPPTVSAVVSDSLVSPTATSGTTEPLTSVPTLTTSTVSLSHPSRIKLLELTIQKFSGSRTKWSTFWDMFEVSVHNNPTLPPIDKFSYLASFLKSTAAEAISGTVLSSANYEEAIGTLKR